LKTELFENDGVTIIKWTFETFVFKFLQHRVDGDLRKIAGPVEPNQKTASSTPKKEAVPYFTRTFKVKLSDHNKTIRRLVIKTTEPRLRFIENNRD